MAMVNANGSRVPGNVLVNPPQNILRIKLLRVAIPTIQAYRIELNHNCYYPSCLMLVLHSAAAIDHYSNKMITS